MARAERSKPILWRAVTVFMAGAVVPYRSGLLLRDARALCDRRAGRDRG